MRSAFSVIEPEPAIEVPLIVEVPHAGLDVPPALALQIMTPVRSVARDADLYVDALYAGAPRLGATLVVAHVSRYVVDLNRAESDIDSDSVMGARNTPKAPRGLIWRYSTEGDLCLQRPLNARELQARLDSIYRPYHQTLTRLIERKRERFGHVVVLAAHSMPGWGRNDKGDAGVARADVVPGSQGRSTARTQVIDAVDRHARLEGLTVKHDDPYRGGFTTRHYGRPHEGVDAIQVEVARRLYMDEQSLEITEGPFEKLRQWCEGLVTALSHLPRG